jgi:hypothetical protein
VAELPDTGESDKYYLVNRTAEEHTATTTDGYVQINNTENAGDLTLTKLNGNATQKTLSGKNLFGFTDGTLTIYDVLFTINGTDVSAKGVSSKASYAQNTNLIGGLVSNGNYPAYTNVTADNSLDLAAGTYTLSATITNSGNTQAGLYIGVGTVGSGISSGEKLSTTGSKTVTLASGQRLYISAWYEGNASALNVDFKATNIQLEAGTTATAYEPYCGGTPSPNPDFPQEIKTVTGAQTVQIAPNQKNLADPQVFIDWVNRTRALCFHYGWGNASTRPNYGTYYGREHVVYYEGSTLYTVRDMMTDPTFEEALIIYDKTGTGQAFKPQTAYTISGEIYGSTANCNLQIRYTDGSYNFTPSVSPNQWTRFTFVSNSAKTIKDISLTWAGGNTRLDLDTFQIEEGASATDYTPFIKSTYAINLGKNLIQADRTLGAPSDTSFINTAKRTFNYGEYSVGITRNNYYSGPEVVTVVEDNGTYTLTPTTGGYGIGLPIKLSPNTKYIVSADITNQENAEIAVGFYEHDGTYIGQVEPQRGERSCMFVTPSNCDFADIILTCAANQTCTYSNIQLELGGLATSYSAYKTPLELAKIGTYQDYIWNDDGTWKIHKEVGKVVLDGTENWALGSMFYCTDKITPLAIQPTDGNIKSDYFTYSGAATNDPSIDIVGGYILRIKYTSKADVATFKAWLSAHNTTVYYALATPTDTEITDSDLIAQLNALAPASMFEGVNNVMLIPSAGAQGELALSYVIYDKYNQHQVYIWSSDDNTWQIILP